MKTQSARVRVCVGQVQQRGTENIKRKQIGNYILNCTTVLTMILSRYKQIYENHIKSPNQYCSA